MNQQVRFDPELVKRYDVPGPRYTSYPTAAQFHEGFDAELYRRHVQFSNDNLIPSPLSIYAHLPFCHTLCYYCGCNKKVTRHARQGITYLEALYQEIALQGNLFDDDRKVIQLHLGGGTPTFFDDIQLERLMATLRYHFNLASTDEREFSIEIDPRTVDADRLQQLAGLGFNRVSLGIQDLDPLVQQAVNRIQDAALALGQVELARKSGFKSVSIDLIYGLPLQTLATFRQTLDAVLEVRPDRLAVYNYAHLPNLFRAQRLIRESQLPTAPDRLLLMEMTIHKLTEAGYVYIGMDHFALPDDELATAQKAGNLHRNFQGYSTRSECDLVGLGVSAIGHIGDSYSQNLKDIAGWQRQAEAQSLPIWRGVTLSTEDSLRRRVIESIMCHGQVDHAAIEAEFGVDFCDFFVAELHQLEQLEADGLVELDEAQLNVTPSGRLLLRSIAMVFDDYLNRTHPGQELSRVI